MVTLMCKKGLTERDELSLKIAACVEWEAKTKSHIFTNYFVVIVWFYLSKVDGFQNFCETYWIFFYVTATIIAF